MATSGKLQVNGTGFNFISHDSLDSFALKTSSLGDLTECERNEATSRKQQICFPERYGLFSSCFTVVIKVFIKDILKRRVTVAQTQVHLVYSHASGSVTLCIGTVVLKLNANMLVC